MKKKTPTTSFSIYDFEIHYKLQHINGFNSKPFIVEILQHHIKQINIFQM